MLNLMAYLNQRNHSKVVCNLPLISPYKLEFAMWTPPFKWKILEWEKKSKEAEFVKNWTESAFNCIEFEIRKK